MVEGDLLDLTVPTLLHALAAEGSTAVLRVQRGTSNGSLFFCEGTLVHALAGEHAGDEAVLALIGWQDGRFRLLRDVDRQPQTVTRPLADFLRPEAGAAEPTSPSVQVDTDVEQQLLDELLTLVGQLDQDRIKLTAAKADEGGVPALLLLAGIVNSMIGFVTARCADPTVLPSRVLMRMADTQPYTQLLGEADERISISTAASVLNALDAVTGDRRRLFHDLGYALLDVLVIYGETVSTFFHSTTHREEWRTQFDAFIEGLWTAVQEVDV